MADLYIHHVTDIKLVNTILPTNSTRLSELTILDNKGHKTTLNIFFKDGAKYNWKSMSISEESEDA
jgi:hypothetical protein